MRKSIKKWLISALACVMACMTFALTACKDSESSQSTNGDGGAETEKPLELTENALVANGQSGYTIVRPAVSTSILEFAAAEMQYFVEQATGVTLPIKTDAELTEYSASSQYISLGETSFSDSLLSAEGTNFSGYKLKTVDKSLFIKGGSANGVLQGVYGFLRETFDYEFYAKDCWKITETSSQMLPKFDLLHNPAIPVVQSSDETDVETVRRLGMFTRYDIWMLAGDSSEGWAHTTTLWLNPDKYTDHPEWYNSGELCFTRDKGDNNDSMFQELLRLMMEKIRTGGDKVQLALTQQDSNSWCRCQDCVEAKKQYNSNLAIMIKYANRLIDAIKAQMQAEGISKEVKLGIFAYQETMDPPVVSDGNGGWKAAGEDVVCHDGVMIEFAPLRMAMHSTFKSQANSSYAVMIEQLHALTDNIGVWWYGTYFHTYLVPLNSFDCLQQNVQFLADNGVYWSFWEGVGGNSVSYKQLRYFLSSKLHDDPTQDYDKLIDDFFKNYYKEAAVPMRAYFEDFRLLSTYNRDVLNMGGDVGSENANAQFYPYASLMKWKEYTEAGYAAIAHYQTSDPDLYQKLYDRVSQESIISNYLLLKIYSAYFTEDDLYSIRTKFKADCLRLNVVKEGNAQTAYLSNLYTEWGI